MEEILLRFPHLSENIFNSLCNKGLYHSKNVSRSWCNFLENQKFHEIRKIMATVEQFHEVGAPWKIFFNKATTETIVALKHAVSKFYRRIQNLSFHNGLTPLHTAAATGNLILYIEIEKTAIDRNPQDSSGWTPYAAAAEYGHLNVFEYILPKVNDKNPVSSNMTLLHWTAAFEQFDMFKRIFAAAKDNNPKAKGFKDYTPLHVAAENGCLEICEFILKNVEDKEPRTTNGRTPLVIAAENRHFNVCILIASYCDFFNVE